MTQPLLGTEMGYFQVTFPGPADNIERLRVPEKGVLVTPAVEVQLNERQNEDDFASNAGRGSHESLM